MKQRKGSSRDAGGFIAIPYAVLESPAYVGLSWWGRSLLIDIASQYRGDNNGSLLCSRAFMKNRGWRSTDMLVKARDELLRARFIHETVKGQRPNRASWYAVTWWALNRNGQYDAGADALFRRGAYRTVGLRPIAEVSALQMPMEKTRAFVRPTVQETA